MTISHTNPAVAQLVTTAGAGQSRTVTIVAGELDSPATVAAGGVAFDPIGGGSTTVNASATGVRAAAPVTVTVSSPGITLLSVPPLLGAGLMAGGGTARLGATAHGGVTVRITSSNPELLLVSRTPTSATAAFVDVPVANGSTDASYWVHGVEEARGTVTLTATATGFTQTQGTTTVAETGLQLRSVPGTTTTLSPDTAIGVNIGVLNASGAVAVFQALRTGAPTLSVTISHTNPAVAQLVTTAGAGQSRTVTIVAGEFDSPATVAAGGVAFDPIGGGSTTVNASATGVRAAAPVTVTVSSPGITLLSVPPLLGAGLMAGGGTARLGATAHGGVTVRITSSNPEVLLVSRTPTSATAAFVDVPVANGSTDASYWVHGVEEARGTVTLTATAAGFTQTQGTTTVAETGLQLRSVPGTTTTLSPDTAIGVNIGVLNASGAVAVVPGVADGCADLVGDDQPHEPGGGAVGDHGWCWPIAHGDDCRGRVRFAGHGGGRGRGLRSASAAARRRSMRRPRACAPRRR